jgi:hypothetical protein
MTESQAKRKLRGMLRSLTAGSLLHLLADLFRESTVSTRRGSKQRARDKVREVAATLFVVGLGVDAVAPHLSEDHS